MYLNNPTLDGWNWEGNWKHISLWYCSPGGILSIGGIHPAIPHLTFHQLWRFYWWCSSLYVDKNAILLMCPLRQNLAALSRLDVCNASGILLLFLLQQWFSAVIIFIFSPPPLSWWGVSCCKSLWVYLIERFSINKINDNHSNLSTRAHTQSCNSKALFKGCIPNLCISPSEHKGLHSK